MPNNDILQFPTWL